MPNPPSRELQVEFRGIPPRPTPGDYPDQADAGKVTIGAEFQGHSIPTPQGFLSAEDYVAVEAGFFGPAGARLRLSVEDFSLRINGKKPVPGLPFGMVLGNVKDPEWAPPEPVISKAHPNLVHEEEDRPEKPKAGSDPPPPVRVPLPVQRALHQRVQRVALPEGDRALPVAGLVFFSYYGKVDKIHTLELIYSGPAGKAELTLDR